MEKKEIPDAELREFLKTLAPDGLFPFILNQARYRGVFLSGAALVNQMRANHGLGPLETLALGQACLAAGLLSSLLKEAGKYSLTVECGGPIQGYTAEADNQGHIRGRLFANPIPLTGAGALEGLGLNGLFGPGFLSLRRFNWAAGEDGRPAEPWTGRIMLEQGSLAKDLALYFYRSEQTPTAVILDLCFDREGRARGAGGLLLQPLPGGGENGALEDRLRELPPLGEAVSRRVWGTGGLDFLAAPFKDFGLVPLPPRPAEFFCDCSRPRFLAFLRALAAEKDPSLKEGPFPLKITCQNCGTDYFFEKADLPD
ncbi:MAG: Hsp33 family molecular chaperone HslO [Spirochaetales bacterium]|jgi:molecular chaperone Hsp33|nr:Hsp33 family molecular chaperone HslO [Spirochaetales bacterium]